VTCGSSGHGASDGEAEEEGETLALGVGEGDEDGLTDGEGVGLGDDDGETEEDGETLALGLTELLGLPPAVNLKFGNP
jgi:hypothetical protein